MTIRLPDVHVPDRLAAAVQALAAERGTSYAELLRQALRAELRREEAVMNEAVAAGLRAAVEELTRRLDTLTVPVGRECPGCGMPRPETVNFTDAMAHAQCDQNVAKLGEQL